jgi:hypothetical protein
MWTSAQADLGQQQALLANGASASEIVHHTELSLFTQSFIRPCVVLFDFLICAL